MLAKVIALLAALTLLGFAAASAIVVDGVNDFPPEALIDPDGGDAQYAEIDMGDVYVANDGGGIYVGYYHNPGVWTGVQIGIALVTTATSGGTFDPWGHQIGFEGMCLPDYVAYINLDSDWHELREWNGIDWTQYANVLTWVDSTDFDEMFVAWEQIGLDCTYDGQIFMELWVTQEGGTKGPLDLSYNDDLQLSTPTETIWDIDTPVMISCYHCIYVYGPSATEGSTWSGIKRLWK
jgi:hypothetical protein